MCFLQNIALPAAKPRHKLLHKLNQMPMQYGIGIGDRHLMWLSYSAIYLKQQTKGLEMQTIDYTKKVRLFTSNLGYQVHRKRERVL